MPRPRSQGRIRPHQRDTDDSVLIIGANITVDESHRQEVARTEANDRKKQTKRDYRNRIKHIYKFLQEKYPAYCEEGGVIEVPDEVRLAKFHHKNTHDLKYAGLNISLIKAFLADKKIKQNGKTSSHTQLRKYNDSILYGAECAEERLPSQYFHEMEKFLNSFKKETRTAKANGQLDENEADPISWALLRRMCQWALEEGNIFVWVYSLLQWGCMARSISIGSLAFHNFRMGEDSIICKYDRHKTDQVGESSHDKHLFGNPFDPLVDLNLAMAIWFGLDPVQWGNHEDFFRFGDANAESAAQRYCSQLSMIFKKHWDELVNYIRPTRANTHSIRKGSGTYSQAGTTCPPPISSTAGRGEWSLGKILDIYWHILEAGDNYLGRILAGLDPMSDDFGTLPPHFKMSDSMANPHIREAMELMYGPILRRWAGTFNDPTGLLLRCLASLVHHSDAVKVWIRNVPGHPFSRLALFHDDLLLRDLKKLVTTDPTDSMKVATGIPPHVSNAILIKRVLDTCIETLKEVNKITDNVRESVKQAFEETAFENGQLTAGRMNTILAEFEERINGQFVDLNLKVGEVRQALPHGRNDTDNFELPHQEEQPHDGNLPFAGEEEQNETPVNYRTYAHGGRFWHVPGRFKLPLKVRLRDGWRLWMKGMPGFETLNEDMIAQAAPIRPFRLFSNALLPPDMKNIFNLHWRPIFSLMEQTPGLEVPVDPSTIDAATLDATFGMAIEYLKTRVQYVFQNPKANPLEWTTSTWCKNISRSAIEKKGTDEDRAKLPPATHRNAPRTQNKRKRTPMEDARRQVPRRIRDHQVPLAVPPTATRRHAQEDSDAFAEAFADAVMTEATQRRDADLQEDVAAEVYADLEEARAERNRVGDGIGKDGSQLFVQKQSAKKLQIVTDRHGGTKKIGHCCVAGCSFPQMELNHHCYATNCRKEVHNLCCGSQQLYDDDNELNMYCSATCKSRGRN
jgi:hypothetical protein